MYTDKKFKGVITVYVSLVVLLVAALLGTMLESAHITGIRASLKSAVSTGTDSLFTMYDKELFEEYGLLFLNEDLLFNDTEEALFKFISWGENQGKTLFENTPSMLAFDLNKVNVNNKYYATDDKGVFFEREVLELMKYQETAKLFSLLTKFNTQINNSEAAYEYVVEENKDYKDIDWSELAKQIKGEEDKKDPSSNDVGPADEPGSDDDFTNEDIEKSLEGSIITQVEAIASGAILSFLVEEPEKLSDKIKTCNLKFSEDHEIRDESGFVEGAVEKILFNEYILSNMNNYLQPSKAGGLSYEVEYIINGGRSDKVNLLGVLNRLLVIRMGLNIVFLLSNQTIGGEALLLAESLVGWTCFVPLIEAVRFLIIAIWAYCESILDLRTILTGKNVDFFKSEVTWSTGLETCVAEVLSGKKAKESENGIGYVMYLRILLFMTDKESRVINTMKAIQLVMESKRLKGFSFTKCIYGIELEASAKARPIFSSMYGFLHESSEYEIKTKWAQTY